MGYKSFLYGLYGDNILFENQNRASQLRNIFVSLMNQYKDYQQIVDK